MSVNPAIEGISLINLVKNAGSAIPNNGFPAIFTRLESINKANIPPGVTLKLGGVNYYLIEGITEDAIGKFIALTMNLDNPYVIELKALGYVLPNKYLNTYPTQYGFSEVLTKTYSNADTVAFVARNDIFLPFTSETLGGLTLPGFTDSYTALTKTVNYDTSDNVKLYTLLFSATSTIAIGEVLADTGAGGRRPSSAHHLV
jgi:hypothetical protein